MNVIAEPLCYLVNTFIQEGKFPNHLKQAFAIPIFKKGDPENAANYRPFSITSALAKIFEKILRQQISEYLTENNLLSQMQFGFRSNYSTTDALLFATENIRQSLDQNQFVAAALLGLSKAFDSISRGILFEKLEELNFDSNALSMMKSYHTERYQKVTLPNCSSDWIKLYQGVPQGTVLGPLLLSVFLNDMENVNDNQCKIIQYAEDTMIFCSHEEPEKPNLLLKRLFKSWFCILKPTK